MNSKILAYLAETQIDPILYNLLFVELDNYIDLQISHENLESQLADLESQVEVLQDAYDGSLEYISHLKEDNDNLESQVIELEQFLAGLDL
jgi:predicted  nucleic acid-binding Zn-ribbon protein